MNEWNEHYDFVVVGSGGGGMVAAMAAADLGRSVLVLESTDRLGGSTGMSGGILWVPNNPLQAGAGVDDSRDAGARYLAALTEGDRTPFAEERRQAFLDAGPEMVRLLMAKGIPIKRCEGWSDYHDELPGGRSRGRSLRTDIFDLRELGEWADRLRVGSFPLPVQWPESRQLALMKRTARGMLASVRIGLIAAWMRISGARLVSMGAALQGRLLKELTRTKDVELRTGTAVTDLVMEDDRVVGVTCETAGGLRRIEARRGVLIASGGFSKNQWLREQHLPSPSRVDWSHTNPGDTGDAIEIAMRHGAATKFDDNAIWLVSSRQPSGALSFHLHDLAKPHCIMVNAAGRRFSDESGSYMANGQNMYANAAAPAWVILDRRHRQRYPWGTMLPGKTPQKMIDAGYLKVAETIEGIAAACGIDPAGLKATCERFNRFAATGVDEDFHRGDNEYDKVFGDPTVKPNPCLGAIEQGPFYAIEVFPGDVGTSGGLIVDRDARVIGQDERPIPGLYASGNCTAPLFGRTYPGAGASIAATCTFGFQAARHALRGN